MMNKLFSQYRNIKSLYILFIVPFCLITLNCSRLIEVDPPYTSINNDNVFNSDATATSAVTYIMVKMIQGASSVGANNSNLFAYAGVASDELTLYSLNNTTFAQYYLNSVTQLSDFGFWTNSYNLIFLTNTAISELNATSNLTNGVKQQLLGESKFLRAFCYFYIVNLYGDVPLVLNTDPLKNANMSRTSVEEVYQQIIQDLEDASNQLSEDYRSGNVMVSTSERVRPTKWAAKALLARVYLYHKDYLLASEAASEVIKNSSLFHLESLDKIFLTNSYESIWQLQNINNSGANTAEGSLFILPPTGPTESRFPVFLSSYLLKDFEDGDQRRYAWVDSVKVKSTIGSSTDSTVYHYAYKYKSGPSTANNSSTEYETVLRLAEQYLIRSEANAHLGNIQTAIDDLNIIRRRSGLGDFSQLSKEELISAIIHERRIELFTEWGHRWLDLKRTNTIDNVMKVITPEKGGNWKASKALWPIGLSELQADPNLVQNPGY